MRMIYLLSMLVSLPVYAKCDLTAVSFVDIEIETRQLTVQGMEERLSLLEAGSDVSDMNTADSRIHQQIQKVYSRYYCSPSQHLVFGYQSENEISLYLQVFPDLQSRLDKIASQFEDISNQIRAYTKNQPTSIEGTL